MQKFECNGCGGQLREEGRFWVCTSCGTKYVLGRNDEGNPFTYQPIEKKQIEFGQMATKASQIKTESIAVKAIKLSESIDVDVHKESTNIELQQNIQIISRFLSAKEWDAAQEQINQILISDCNNAEAHWYGWMCDKHISSEDKLINSFYMFTQADATKLDDILSNASPAFAKHIIELLFDKAYLNDNMCFSIMSVILPYAKNEAVLSEQEYKLKTSNALDVVVSKLYPNSFEYLLRSTLSENDVDLYISYLQKFGDKCAPAPAQKYYSEILKVDPGNTAIHKKLILSDIKANSTVEKCIFDFENLLKYSDNADAEVLYFFDFINSNKTTTANISQFVWQLIGYHSGAPEALKAYIINYSRILLQSSLWEQAKRNLQLILSFDSQNAFVYWLLCLVKLQARNESEIKYKKDNLIDCPEFKKSLALYQSSGNEKKATELLSYTQHQKTTKKIKKILLIIVAAVVALYFLNFLFGLVAYHVKYNKNIDISFSDMSYSNNWSSEDFVMSVKYKGLVDVDYLSGIMNFYDANGKMIASTSLNLYDVPHGDDLTLNLTLDYNSAKLLSGIPFDSVKVTFAITEIKYDDSTYIDLGVGKEKTIKSISKNGKEIAKQREAEIKQKYDAAMEAYDKADFNSPTFHDDLSSAAAMVDEIWGDILKSEVLLKDLYDKACSYQQNEEYFKAYILFAALADYDYKDSSSRTNACYNFINSN